MRLLATCFSVLALAACSPRSEPAASTPAQPVQAAGGASACRPWRNAFGTSGPEWIQVARTARGAFVQFRPRGVTRDLATCETSAQIRVLHRAPETWSSADGKVEVQYQKEVLDYRFRCAEGQFALTGRRILGADDSIVQEVPIGFSNAPEDWRPVAQGGPAAVIQPPVCKN